MGAFLKTEEVSISFFYLFLKKNSLGFIMVCHIGGVVTDESGDFGP